MEIITIIVSYRVKKSIQLYRLALSNECGMITTTRLTAEQGSLFEYFILNIIILKSI